MKINPNGFREYDARWLFEKDIDLEGITDLGKGLGTQIINHTKKTNPRVIVGHDYRSYSEEIKTALKIILTFSASYFELFQQLRRLLCQIDFQMMHILWTLMS